MTAGPAATATPTPAERRRSLALPRTYGIVVGGEESMPASTFAAVDPSTGNDWANVAQASDSDVEAAVEAARRAFPSWRRTTLAERQSLLWQLADRVAEVEDWPSLLAIENGRPIREAVLADVPVTVDIFRYYAGLVRDHVGEHLDQGDRNVHIYTVAGAARADRGSDPVELAADLDGAQARARRSRPATPSCSSRPSSPPRASSSSCAVPPTSCRPASSTS